jgi:hypothetical protein
VAQIACQQGPPTSRARARGLHGPNRERIRDRICSDAALRCCTPCGCSYRPGGRPLRAAIRVARTHAVPRACHAPANPLNTCNTEGRDRCSRDPRRPHDVEDVRSRQTSKLGLSRVDRADRRGGGRCRPCSFSHGSNNTRKPISDFGTHPIRTEQTRCTLGARLRPAPRGRGAEAAPRGGWSAEVDRRRQDARPPPRRRPGTDGSAVDDHSAEAGATPPDRRPPCARATARHRGSARRRPGERRRVSGAWDLALSSRQGPQDPNCCVP